MWFLYIVAGVLTVAGHWRRWRNQTGQGAATSALMARNGLITAHWATVALAMVVVAGIE